MVGRQNSLGWGCSAKTRCIMGPVWDKCQLYQLYQLFWFEKLLGANQCLNWARYLVLTRIQIFQVIIVLERCIPIKLRMRINYWILKHDTTQLQHNVLTIYRNIEYRDMHIPRFFREGHLRLTEPFGKTGVVLPWDKSGTDFSLLRITYSVPGQNNYSYNIQGKPIKRFRSNKEVEYNWLRGMPWTRRNKIYSKIIKRKQSESSEANEPKMA